MLRFLMFLLLSMSLAWSAKPMEPLTNYNVILVHGAADSVNDGLKGSECIGTKSPYALSEEYVKDTANKPWQIGNAPKMLGSYYNTDKLTNWLDTKIFENNEPEVRDRIDSTHIYLQRSFVNPAGSPKYNGYEIGNPEWRCGERRSLIEEAKEVKAKGRGTLSDLRESNVWNRDKLPPSRNILVAHSMGGGATQTPPLGLGYLC
jgi:hypothetical protein